MTKTNEPLADTQRMLAREDRLRAALMFALQSPGSTASGAVIGVFAAEIENADDVAAVRMLQDAMTAFVNGSPRETQAVHSWHAQRDGYDPEQDAIVIVDLARHAARTAQLSRLSGTQFHTGVAGIEAFRADLVDRFGESVPEVAELQKCFAKVGESRTSGGLTITGVVARIIHVGRLLGDSGQDLDKTRKRVDRVLSRLPNPREISAELPIPPIV